jgi:hypothetical protein
MTSSAFTAILFCCVPRYLQIFILRVPLKVSWATPFDHNLRKSVFYLPQLSIYL